MNNPHLPVNQPISDSNLRASLLGKVDIGSSDPVVKALTHHKTTNIDEFWEKLVVPMREKGNFDQNKIKWYFEVYRAGAGTKYGDGDSSIFGISDEKVRTIVDHLSSLELDDYFKLNSHYLTNCGLFLTSWINYKKSQQRLDTIFKSDDPCDWITEMEKFTKENPETFTIDMAPEVSKILEKVQIVMTLYM